MWFFFISDTLTVEKFFLVYGYFGFWMSLVVELFATISLTKYSVLLAFISAPSSSCAFLGLVSWSAPEVLGCSGHASCLSSHPHFVLSQPSVSLTCSFVPDCLSSVQSSLLAVLSTIIYFIHFFFISESFNYLIFSLQNLFPCWSFFSLFPVFSFILLSFSWIWLSFPFLWLTWMEFMFACVPFQVTGDFYISTFGIFTQHLTYVSVLSLNRVTEKFGSFWSSYVALLLSYPGFLCYALCISWFACLPVLFGDPLTVQSRWLNPQDHSDRREQPQRWYLHGQRTCLPTFKTSEILISLLEGDTWVWGCTAEDRWGSGRWSTGPWPQDEGLSNSVSPSVMTS